MSEHNESQTEEVTRISKKKVKRLCANTSHSVPGTFSHTKEVFSDGWTKYTCSMCGQVKFTRGYGGEG